MSSSNQSSKVRYIILLAMAGWVCAFYLLYHGIQLSTSGLESPSICNINSYFNCDSVALSKYSSIFGIPIAQFLITFYSIIFFLALWTYFAIIDDDKINVERGLGLGLVLSTIFMLGSLTQGFISFAILKQACIFCIASYIFNILIFVFYLSLYKIYKTHKGNFIELLLLPPNFGFFLLAIMALHAFMPKIIENSLFQNAPPDYDQIVAQYMSESKKISFQEDGYPSIGAEKDKATMTIVEYSDFQCPHCAKTANDLDPFITGNSDRVRFVFKYFPLNMCDPQNKSHGLACNGAKAMHCLYKKKGDLPAIQLAHNDYFPNQKNLSDTYIKEAAIKYGISADELNSCINDPKTHQEIMDSINEAKSAGVNGTPAIFVNGRKMNYPMPKVLIKILNTL